MKIFLIILIIALAYLSFAQIKFVPLNIKSAFDKGTRSYDGKPGENYWQNSADYKIKVKLDPYQNFIEGVETINYYNNSPDTLNELVLRLYQNFYRCSNARNFMISSNSITDGVEIKRLLINNNLIDLKNNSALNYSNTNLIVLLSEKISPNSITKIELDWSFAIPGGSPIRMGIYDSTTFMIAYWYPQIAVYDDIDGWDKIDFNGEQEMYNDFNNYDVEIEVPDNFIIWSTGVLQNANEILSKSTHSKYIKAHESEEVITIISNNDYDTQNNILSGKEKNFWHFMAENVTDFAFGCSDHYLWDAVSLGPDKISDRKVFISAAYNPDSKDFYNVAMIAKKALEYFSTDLPGIPFPYPSLTVFNGSGGMEFPMILNNGSSSTLAGTIYLTSHEASHSYFPFFMGINEKKYAWMDEGMARMLPIEFQSSVEGYNPLTRSSADYSAFAGTEMEMPPIVPSILLRGNSYRRASYDRPGFAYHYLQDFLGRETFRKALQEYILRWNGKHPIPYDFFNSFDDYLGKDLAWYWNPWFFEHGYPDLGIKDVKKEKDIIKVHVEKIGNVPIPIDLYLIDKNQTEHRIYKTASVWENGDKHIWIEMDFKDKPIEIRLGNKQIPDTDQSNNIFHFD